MKIGLDFDDTYSADPELFDNLIRVATFRGHEITFVTWRCAVHHSDETYNDDIEEAAYRNRINIVYCAGKAKDTCYAADIWMDDSPWSIYNKAAWCKT